MGRQYFDDGSFLDTLDDGSTVSYDTEGQFASEYPRARNMGPDSLRRNLTEPFSGGEPRPGFSGDAREEAKLDKFVPRPGGDPRPWWERVATYGLTRAIDSQFGPPEQNKTQAPPTFAGQNGRTYSQVQGGGYGQQPEQQQGGGIMPILLIAGAAFLLLG